MGEVAEIREAGVQRRHMPTPRNSGFGPTSATARIVPGSGLTVPGLKKKPAASVGIDQVVSARGVVPSAVAILPRLAPAFVGRLSPSLLGTLILDALLLFGSLLTGRMLFNLLTAAAMGVYFCVFIAAAMEEGVYGDHAQELPSYPRLIKATLWTLLVVTLASGVPSWSGVGAIVGLSGSILLLLCGWRWIWAKVRGRVLTSPTNVLLIGSASTMQSLAHLIPAGRARPREVRAFIPEWQMWDISGPSTLRRIAREEHVDEVIVASDDSDLVEVVLSECEQNSLDVSVVPNIGAGTALNVENVCGIPLIHIRAERLPEWQLALKRVADVSFSALAGIALLPLAFAIATLIKVDSRGPVFYRSLRIGHKGRRFICYKFRTMIFGADGFKAALRAQNQRQGAFFKISSDPRVTRLGHWLRRYSLDEIPQLWNVLRGEMSLVGPRPHPVDDAQRYHLDDLQRLDATPGITGLWQIAARTDPSFRRCVDLDVDYIKHWNFRLDFQILWKTFGAVLRGTGV